MPVHDGVLHRIQWVHPSNVLRFFAPKTSRPHGGGEQFFGHPSSNEFVVGWSLIEAANAAPAEVFALTGTLQVAACLESKDIMHVHSLCCYFKTSSFFVA